jgi:hypothetical protein
MKWRAGAVLFAVVDGEKLVSVCWSARELGNKSAS